MDLDDSLSPDDLRSTLLNATHLLSQAIEVCIEADVAYAKELNRCLSDESSAARATIRAEASDQYAEKVRAHGQRARLVEMIRTAKAVLRSREFE